MTESTCDWCHKPATRKVLMRGVPGMGGIYVRACRGHQHLLPQQAVKGRRARVKAT